MRYGASRFSNRCDSVILIFIIILCILYDCRVVRRIAHQCLMFCIAIRKPIISTTLKPNTFLLITNVYYSQYAKSRFSIFPIDRGNTVQNVPNNDHPTLFLPLIVYKFNFRVLWFLHSNLFQHFIHNILFLVCQALKSKFTRLPSSGSFLTFYIMFSSMLIHYFSQFPYNIIYF